MIDRHDYLLRLTDRLALDVLADRFVLIVGIGSVGSRLALELGAGCGVGHLALVDGDRLEAPNLPRHVLPADYVGTNKAEGMAAYLSTVPGLDVGAIPRHLDESWSDLHLDRLLASADAIIVATDSRRVQRRIAARALALDIPAIVPGLYAAGGGEVFVQLGPAHPCFRCWDAFRPDDAEVRGTSALSADTLAVIQRAVYLALAVLDPRSPEARDLAAPAADGRPRQLFVERPRASLLRVPMSRRPGCPSCAVGPSPLNDAPRLPWRRFVSAEPGRSARDWAFVHTHHRMPPTVDRVRLSEAVVLEGSVVSLSWETTNATHVQVDGAGVFPTRGIHDVVAMETRAFRIEAVNPFGRDELTSPTVRVLRLPSLPPIELPPMSAPQLGMGRPDMPPFRVPQLDPAPWPRFDFPGRPA